MNALVLNDTMRKFGAPQTIIHSFQYWSVQLRPAQATLGALVMVAHEPARAFSELSAASFIEMHAVVSQIEFTLTKAFQYDKINYLMLMMVDPDVHFHIIPRYAQSRLFADTAFVDAGWPAVPQLGHINETNETINQMIIARIKACWL
ncbi:MAG: HIT family protein [Nitrosomonas sp.]|nr:HIT family protein [Nitrosomonas sp.]